MGKSSIPDHIFRGYDLRGVVDKDLDEDLLFLLGQGYATFLQRRRINEAVVGRDNRLTSENYQRAFMKGLLDSGINVVDIGLSLSQIVYFAQYYYQAKGAAMVTGSHNPKEFNGLKLATGFSETMVTEEVVEYREIVKSGKFITAATKGKLRQDDVYPAYKADILKRVKLEGNPKVVVDACNGPPGVFMPEILRGAGCEVIEQLTNLDGSFPNGAPDPTEEGYQKRLAERVVKEKADIGFSYDTDGDRVGIVDEKGTLIWNDTLLSIFTKDVLDFLPGAKIVYNTLCSKQVPEVITAAGGLPIIEKVGHSFIKARVREERAPFGGELSGHFFFMDNFYGHDDGAMASLRLLSYLTRQGKRLSQVIAELPQYISSPEIKLGCPDEIKFQLIDEKITKDLKKEYPQGKYTTLDGIRVETPERMATMRASQNGPYLTVKFEARDQAGYEELKGQIAAILHRHKEIDWTFGVNISALE